MKNIKKYIEKLQKKFGKPAKEAGYIMGWARDADTGEEYFFLERKDMTFAVYVVFEDIENIEIEKHTAFVHAVGFTIQINYIIGFNITIEK